MASLYQNVIIGDIVRAFEEKNLVSGVTKNDNGQTVITITFEDKKEEEAI